MKSNTVLEKTLKSLGEAGYKIGWHYETTTNSIIIRLERMIDEQRHVLTCVVRFEDLYFGSGRQELFEFNMARIIKELAKQFECDTQEADQT